jgi:hypothetical protein
MILNPGEKIVIGPVNEQGVGLMSRDNGDGTVTAMPGRAIRKGEPIPDDTKEVAYVVPSKDKDGTYVVEMSVTLKGPAQVATKAYKAGWDQVFGSKGTRGEA